MLLSVQMAAKETTTEYFGKRGISWHGAMVTTHFADGTPFTFAVHDILQSETSQDFFTVAGILETLLLLVKRLFPAVTEAVIQSDNAGYYTASGLHGTCTTSRSTLTCADHLMSLYQ